MNWTSLSNLPDANGLAGVYAGVCSDMLVVAGGCNFPGDARPWNGGFKSWYDAVYLLEEPSADWCIAGRLPWPMAYGISLTWNNKVVCIGGRDNDHFYSDVFMMSWINGTLVIEYLPPLPVPHASGCGVIVNNIIYVVGGQASAVNTETLTDCWSLDLSQPADRLQWKLLEPLPGPSRMLSVAATCGEDVYVFSGVHLSAGANAKREYLTDAYKYDPFSGWEQLAELPYAIAAAPGPAPFINGRFLLLGGDDGVIAGTNALLKEDHPGFTKEILQFDLASRKWIMHSSLPSRVPGKAGEATFFSPVTTPAVKWKDQIVFSAGEIKPGLRTSQVVCGSFR